ncbi:MAG: TonB-dependent receptor [Spongiibacteraceae bacterium]|nr:TonB-dependent receptor [Spongiibacteraceae bacterium]
MLKRKFPIVPSMLAVMVGVAPDVLAQAGRLEEVIITASRRMETSQDTALAMSVFTGEQLSRQGVASAVDLQTAVPGLTISSGGANTSAFIRGVGSLGVDANASSAIAWNINGVPIGRPSAIGPIFFDLQRVEVLKGPQGTLYGKNASGGAINLITNMPSFTFGGNFSVDLGNYDLRRFSGAVDVPVSETFALRAATQITRRDGYLSDGYNDQETDSFRLIGLWEATDKLSVSVTTEWAEIDGMGQATVPSSDFQSIPGAPWTGPSRSAIQPPGFTPIEDNGYIDNTIWAVSAEINYEMDWATMTFIPAYRDLDSRLLTWTGGFHFDTDETSEQQTYELRFSGEIGDQLEWVTGYFFLKERQSQHYEMISRPFQYSVNDVTLDTESHAVFGEVRYSLTDDFRLIGGLRYTHDDKGQRGIQLARNPMAGFITATNDNYGKRVDEEVSWKIGAEWDVGLDSMIYATIATGYQSGGFFPSVPHPDNSYEPEQMKAFTLGSKNQFLNNSLQANFELFYWEYDDKHERFLGATQTGSTGLLTTNAGAATLHGIEVDLIWQATANDRLSFNATWMNSEYDEFEYTAFIPRSASHGIYSGCKLGTPQVLNPTDPDSPGSQFVDCSGNDLVRAPDWSGTASYQRIFPLNAGMDLVFDVSAQFASEQFLTPDFIDSVKQDSYVTWDASLTLNQSDRWHLTLWGRNLTDEEVYTGGNKFPFSSPLALGGDPSLAYLDIRPPRTYGVTFGMNF